MIVARIMIQARPSRMLTLSTSEHVTRRGSKRHSNAVAEEHTEPEMKRVKTEDLPDVLPMSL